MTGGLSHFGQSAVAHQTAMQAEVLAWSMGAWPHSLMRQSPKSWFIPLTCGVRLPPTAAEQSGGNSSWKMALSG